MARHAATQERLDVALEVLTEHHPMTVRQVYYQLVSRQVIENTRSMYQTVSNLLVQARQEGLIPWHWIEDRVRQVRGADTWDGLSTFAVDAARWYRREIWSTQPAYVEVWLEKDALSGIFEGVLDEYRVLLNVGRGYDGWSSIHQAALRYQDCPEVTILYFGDFDPSGEDMVRSLEERLQFFLHRHPGPKSRSQGRLEVIKCALNYEHIRQYRLPPDFTKSSDTRSAAFIEEFGDIAVELDALPVDVLQARLVEEVEARMDLYALNQVITLEEQERQQLQETLSRIR